MKKNIQYTITVMMLVFSYLSTKAQVRFNGQINDNSLGLSSAFLDASASMTWNNTTNIGKGMVFPQADLTEFASFAMIGSILPSNNPNAFDGFLLFNIGTGVAAMGGDSVFPGFYYYRNTSGTLNGGNWVQITPDDADGDAWGVDGEDQTSTISRTGNVGIGISAPSARLHVSGGILRWENGDHQLDFNTPLGHTGMIFNRSQLANRSRFDVLNASNATAANRFFKLSYSGESGVSIRKGGNVGIGRNDPIYRLDVNGSFRNTTAGLFTVMAGNDNMTATPARGIRMWNWNDTNWGIYMARSGDTRAMNGGIAPSSGTINSYAVRFRTGGTSSARGFIFENSLNQALMSIRGNDGYTTFEDDIDVIGTARVRTLDAGTTSDEVVVADANGVLKKVTQSSVGDGDAWGVNGEDETSWVARAGNVGIGLNTAPSQKLHVVGNAQIGTAGEEVRLGYMGYNNWAGISHKNRASAGNYALIQNSSGRTLINASTGQAIQFNINNAAGAMLDQYSNFGIGTTTPAAKLHVVGNARITSMAAGTVSNQVVMVDGNGELKKIAVSGIQDGIGTDDQKADIFDISGGNLRLSMESNAAVHTIPVSSFQDGDAWGVNGENETSWVARTGNVGIGLNTAPAQKLHVAGNAQIGSAGEEVRLGYMGYNDWAGISHKNRASAGNYSLMQNSLGSTFINASSGQAITFRINNSEGARLHSNNNFGVGTVSPAAKLHVAGNARITTMAAGTSAHQVVVVDGNGELKKVAQSSVGGGGADGDAWGVNGENETSWVARTGNVGVGLNTAPSQKLHVAGNARIGTAGEEARIGDIGLANWTGFSHNAAATSTKYALAQNSLGHTLLNAASGQPIRFRINNVDKMILASNGRLGIGTTSPAPCLFIKSIGSRFAQNSVAKSIRHYLLQPLQMS
mgnify:FL=1